MFVRVRINAADCYSHVPAAGHRVSGIDHQIQQGVFQLAGVGADVAWFVGELILDANRRAECALEDGFHAFDAQTHVEVGWLERLATRVGEHFLREVRCKLGSICNRVDVFEAFFGRQFGVTQQLSCSADYGDEIVEIVGESPGYAPEGFQSL